MGKVPYDSYSLADTYQKTHLFGVLTRSFSDTFHLVHKKRTRAFSMKYNPYFRAYELEKEGA